MINREKSALKNLYKLLVRHQAQLEGLWMFPLGHQNTRDLINQTLNNLDSLTALGIGQDMAAEDFIKECKEAAYYELMKEQVDSVLARIEGQYSSLLVNNSEWNNIKAQMASLQNENNTVYVMDELYYFISKISKELNEHNSPLFKPVIELRGELRSIWNKFYENNKELVSQSRHFELKTEKLKSELEQLSGYRLDSIQLKPVNNGINDSFDLVLEGQGSNPFLETFTCYNSKHSMLDQERVDVRQLWQITEEQVIMLRQLAAQQIPLLQSLTPDRIDCTLFPESLQNRVKAIISLKELVGGNWPVDLNVYSKDEQDKFLDRKLIATFDPKNFTLEQVDQLKGQQLKTDFIALYHKMHKADADKLLPWYSRLKNHIVSYAETQQTDEDWSREFSKLRARVINCVNDFLEPQIRLQIEALGIDTAGLHREALAEMGTYAEQIEALQAQMEVEMGRSGVVIKRFDTLAEFYEFEVELRKAVASQPKPAADNSANAGELELVVEDVAEELVEVSCTP